MVMPRFIVRRSRIPVVVGTLVIGRPFLAQTIGPWIFVRGDVIHVRVLRHETRHVHQFYIGFGIGLALWLLFQPSMWWLLATPLTFTVAYVLAGIVALVQGKHAYRQNWFERDARRYAGEPL